MYNKFTIYIVVTHFEAKVDSNILEPLRIVRFIKNIYNSFVKFTTNF